MKPRLISIRLLSTQASTPASASTNSHFYQNKTLESYASRQAFPISLRQLVFFGKQVKKCEENGGEDVEKLIRGANFVITELPVRLSHRIRDMQSLPFIVANHPFLQSVYKMYVEAFDKIRKRPLVRNLEENEQFCEFMLGLLDDHKVVIPRLAVGLSESPPSSLSPSQLDIFLTRMLRSRISRRIIAQQHIALSEQFNRSQSLKNSDKLYRFLTQRLRLEGYEENPSQYVGIVNTKVVPSRVVIRCGKLLGLALEGEELTGKISLRVHGIEEEQSFTYVEEHLEYIIFELLKNSARTTLERYPQNPESRPIDVAIVFGVRDVVIRISDRGGGIPPPSSFISGADRVDHAVPLPLPNPSFSSAARREIFSFANMRYSIPREPLASPAAFEKSAKAWRNVEKMEGTVQEQMIRSEGVEKDKRNLWEMMKDHDSEGETRLGIGLPLSRIYAEYFGGSLEVYTMPGYGTDTYLTIPRVGNQTETSQ